MHGIHPLGAAAAKAFLVDQAPRKSPALRVRGTEDKAVKRTEQRAPQHEDQAPRIGRGGGTARGTGVGPLELPGGQGNWWRNSHVDPWKGGSTGVSWWFLMMAHLRCLALASLSDTLTVVGSSLNPRVVSRMGVRLLAFCVAACFSYTCGESELRTSLAPHTSPQAELCTWGAQACFEASAKEAAYIAHCQGVGHIAWTSRLASTRLRSSSTSSQRYDVGMQELRPSRQRPHGQPKQKQDKEEAKSSKEDPSAAKSPAQDAWQIFPHKAPWITSTPQTRVTTIRDKDTENEDRTLPPQPVLPAPPAAPLVPPQEGMVEPLSQQEVLLMSHLKGLRSLNVLPESLAEQLQILELRQQATTETKSLNHGHLNRLNKARTQVANCTRRIQSLDREWQGFLTVALERMQMHAMQFQTHRSDLMENLNRRLRELDQVKKEVNEASQSLVGRMPQVELQVEEHPPQADLLRFQELAQSLSAAAPNVELIDDDMEDQELHPASPHSDKEEQPKKPHLAPAPFRSPGSPGKVATTHLKPAARDRPKEK
eukprot:Skav210827  [mRNA]  locus=scaffold1597:402160:403864:- [translate_table: standard]